MKSIKNFKIVAILLIGLQAISMSAHKQIEEKFNLDEAVEKFPHIIEGFDILQSQDLVKQSFHDYMQENVKIDESEDDETFNFPEQIHEAHDLLINTMKVRFLQILQQESQLGHTSIAQIQDPLFHYVMKHRTDFMEYDFNQWVNVLGDDDMNMLMRAVSQSDFAMVLLLINIGADLTIGDHYGRTPLYKAVLQNNIQIANALIAAGANINIVDMDNQTLLYIAVLHNYPAMVTLLINSGADVNMSNRNLLHVAAAKNCQKIIPMLLAAGMDINSRDGYMQWTTLHVAVSNDNIDLVNQLVASGADLNIRDAQGRTPLYYAISDKYLKKHLPERLKIIEILIENDANFNIPNNDGRSPLHCAVVKNLIDVAKLLIAYGADMNAVDNQNNRPEQLIESIEMRNVFEQAQTERRSSRCVIS